MNLRKRKNFKTTIIFIILVIAAFISVFPLYWVISTSFKSPIDVFRMPPTWIFKPTLENYQQVLNSRFPGYFANSMIVSAGTLVISLVIGIPAAYGLSRGRMRKKQDIDFFLLSTRMAPPIAFIVPFYLMWSKLSLYDKYPGLILVYVLFTTAFIVWMMKAFFDDVSPELDEAAMVDGCTKWGAFLRVALPCVRGGIIATVILGILLTWNEFFYALILTAFNTKTMPVALPGYIGFVRLRWGELTAAATIVVAPVIIFSLFVQKYLMRGLAGGYSYK
jgi:multiple sugar transport system permease protein